MVSWFGCGIQGTRAGFAAARRRRSRVRGASMPRSPRIDNDDTPMAFAHASSGRSLQEIRSIRSIEVQVATTVCSEARGSLASLIGLKYRTMKPMACAFFIGFEQPETAVEHLRIHLVIVYSEPFFSTRNIGFPYKVNLAVFEHD